MSESKSLLKKRFIAGAVCPRCQKMDGIQILYYQEGNERHCIFCGFSDQQSQQTIQEVEMETRVNPKQPQIKKESNTQVLKFYPSPNQSKKSK